VYKLIILAIIVAAVGWAEAATYYVDSDDGRDDPSQSGGPLDPWRTLSYALSCVSGENTFMCRGTFEEEVIVDYDDRGSEFAANTAATLKGWFGSGYEAYAKLTGFDVYGYAGSGGKSGIDVRDCYFINPLVSALAIGRYHGYGGAYDCVFEDCKSVMRIYGFEFGAARFEGCTIKDCENGIYYGGEANVSAISCRFDRIADTAFRASIWGEAAQVNNCVITDCGTGVSMYVSEYSGAGFIGNSTFRGNNTPISVGYQTEDWGGIEVRGNVVAENYGPGVTAGGVRIKLRGNVIKDNDGHGVYITGGAPDLGKPGAAGRNVFNGNRSGYDVYNASPENIPAYGNTWDPRSEREMKGKTWQAVNVTRIYDHWDNPKVGYVMWSEPVGIEPASLGQIKASFKGAPTSGQGVPGRRPSTAKE
jgi:hypothetical protein